MISKWITLFVRHRLWKCSATKTLQTWLTVFDWLVLASCYGLGKSISGWDLCIFFPNQPLTSSPAPRCPPLGWNIYHYLLWMWQWEQRLFSIPQWDSSQCTTGREYWGVEVEGVLSHCFGLVHQSQSETGCGRDVKGLCRFVGAKGGYQIGRLHGIQSRTRHCCTEWIKQSLMTAGMSHTKDSIFTRTCQHISQTTCRRRQSSVSDCNITKNYDSPP